MPAIPVRFLLLLIVTLFLAVPFAACGGGDDTPVLKVGGIPDQDTARLARRYEIFSEYLSGRLDVRRHRSNSSPA